MLVIKHPALFNEIVEAAKHATQGESRWVKAIERAFEEMTEYPERFEWMGTHILIHSPTSDEVYEAQNNSCLCPAFEFRKPCKHRASARLWQHYLDAVAAEEWEAQLGKPVQSNTRVSNQALV